MLSVKPTSKAMTSVGEGKGKRKGISLRNRVFDPFRNKSRIGQNCNGNRFLTPIDVVFFRFLFATFVLGIYILIRHTNLHLNKGQFWRLVFLAIVGYAMMNLTYYGAFHRMSVSLTGMLHYIYPAAALVIARMVVS